MATEFATRRRSPKTRTWFVTGAVACVLALVATLLVVLRGAAGTDPFARLRPLDPRVEVRAAGEGDYALGTTGQQLQVGDTVRTDLDGRGEIAYHEGSLTRLGPDAVFELVELTDAPALHLRLEVGQLWQRVARLTGTEGSFRLHTPAATATVAGTVFAADCTVDGTCTFTVLEGRLHLTTTTGEELTLEAGEQVTIAPGGAPGDIRTLTEDDLWDDDWTTYNLERDGETPPPTPEPTPEPTPAPVARSVDASSLVRPGAEVQEVHYGEMTGAPVEEIAVVSTEESWNPNLPTYYVEVFTWQAGSWVRIFDASEYTASGDTGVLLPPTPDEEPFERYEAFYQEADLVDLIDFEGDGVLELVLTVCTTSPRFVGCDVHVLSATARNARRVFRNDELLERVERAGNKLRLLIIEERHAECCPTLYRVQIIGDTGEGIGIISTHFEEPEE